MYYNYKTFPGLQDLLCHQHYNNAFPHLHTHHPHHFTFLKPWTLAMEQAYIALLLVGAILTVAHMATTSDNHVAFITLIGHLVAPGPAELVELPETFWHRIVANVQDLPSTLFSAATHHP